MGLCQQPANQPQNLRQFGFVMGAMIPALFGLLFPFLFNHPFPRWPWISAMLFVVAAVVAPKILSPIYCLWMKLGHLLNYVNTRILLSVVFYLLVLPIGLVKRFFGADAMTRRFEPNKKSYRSTITEKKPTQTLERPF